MNHEKNFYVVMVYFANQRRAIRKSDLDPNSKVGLLLMLM